MATDREPTATAKLLHLIFLSTFWGMQIWVTFISSEYKSSKMQTKSKNLPPLVVHVINFVLLLLSLFSICPGFVMDNHLNRHTFGFIQSRLFPFYHHMGSACAFFNLAIYAVYHPSDLLDEKEAFQVGTCRVKYRSLPGRNMQSQIQISSR